EAVLVSAGPELTFKDLPNPLGRGQAPEPFASYPVMSFSPSQPAAALAPESAKAVNGHAAAPQDTLLQGRATYERGLIQHTLESCKFNRSRAAGALGISRVTLYKKIKQYGLAESHTR